MSALTDHLDDLTHLRVDDDRWDRLTDALREIEAEIVKAEDESREWYYENRHTHKNGIAWSQGFEEGWDHANQRIRAILDRIVTGSEQ